MNKKELLARLRQISLFADLDRKTCKAISARGRLKHFNAGNVIPSSPEGDSALYVVLSGELAALERSDDGQAPTAIIKYESTHFFEGLPLRSNSRIDRIEVVEDSDLLVLDRGDLDEIVVSFLRMLTFFKNLSDDQLQAIAREVYLENYSAGDILFRQNDPSDALYIVVSGEVAMVRHSEDGDQTLEEEIGTYSDKSSFGERGVLADQTRATSARVKQRTAMLVLPAKQLQALAEQHTEIALGLYRYFADLLEEQSVANWRAARDLEKMKEVIQSTKMAALGQLVAGIAHEINSPVGSIKSNSTNMREILGETQTYFDQLPQVLTTFKDEGVLEEIAEDSGVPLDDRIVALIETYTDRQIEYVADFYENEAFMTTNFADMKEISEELFEASRRIEEMVRSLANFARLDEAELKAVDIHEGLESTLSLLRHELKYKVNVEKNYSDLPEITCYPNQLNQVFMNILMNAIQALEVDKLPENEKGLIEISTYSDKNYAYIAIRDTGKGIPPQNFDKIFDPFFSTKGAAAAAGGLGLGMGLSISQKIVREKHQGEIYAESELGKGTTFTIKLPLELTIPVSETAN